MSLPIFSVFFRFFRFLPFFPCFLFVFSLFSFRSLPFFRFLPFFFRFVFRKNGETPFGRPLLRNPESYRLPCRAHLLRYGRDIIAAKIITKNQPAPKYHTRGCSRSSVDSPGANTGFAAFEPFSSCEFRASIARTAFCAILWRKLLQKVLFKKSGFGRINFENITKQYLYKANSFACSLANRDKPVAAKLQRKCSVELFL